MKRGTHRISHQNKLKVCGILKIKFEVRNQWPRKPPSTELCENRRVSKISCPPYWIRHLKKWKSDVKFVISDPKSPKVRSSTKIVGFPKYYVRHIGSAILNYKSPMSNSHTATLKASEYRVSRKLCGFQNCMSDILDICYFAKATAIWDRWDNFFLIVQLFPSPLIIVTIKSFSSKKNHEKKNSRFFGSFLQI